LSNTSESLYVVGLGNPGDRYRGTRHNAGFDFLDLLCSEFKSSWTEDKRSKYLISNVSLPNSKTLRMLKPMSYMNLSGEPLLAATKFYKDLDCSKLNSPLNLLVVHDELDFKPGELRFKSGGGAGGHKGIQSIISILGTQTFFRYRIGIGHPRNVVSSGGIGSGASFGPSMSPSMIDVSDWVLSRHDKSDLEGIRELNVKVARNLSENLLDAKLIEDIPKILSSSVLVP